MMEVKRITTIDRIEVKVLNLKKQRIMEESMKLFAEKGFHATSIQEIVKRSEISKGAFYLYFSSKEELTIEIFDHYTGLIMDEINDIQAQDKSPKQKLIEQIKMFLNLITNHKEYIIMSLRDHLHIGPEINQLVMRMNRRAFEWIDTAVTEIYGEKVTPYIVDISIHLDGILQSYFKSIIMHDLHLDNTSLAQFIVNRLDDMINGIINSEDKAQITYDQLTFSQFTKNHTTAQLVAQLKRTVQQLQLTEERKKQLKEAADIIIQEMEKSDYNHIILEGILTQFNQIPSLAVISRELASQLNVSINKGRGDKV